MKPGINDEMPHDLTLIEKDCWQRMANGALQNRNAFQTPAVANSGAAGINMRTIVLRKVCPLQKQLSFYSDIRSGKWAELRQNNSISWLFYDADTRIQIRAGGLATLHHNDDLADKAWSETNINNRKNYLSVLIPSSETAHPVSGLPTGLEHVDITLEQSEAGRKNFGVVVTNITWMEWLLLSSNGHRRAAFIYGENKNFTASWLIP